MRHLSTILKIHLPDDYKQAIEVILQLIEQLKLKQSGLSLRYMFLADYIEQYGLDDYETSIDAIEKKSHNSPVVNLLFAHLSFSILKKNDGANVTLVKS